MTERHQDFELLQRFVRHGEQSAFESVVRRHLNLVYATALRKTGDEGAAQEVAQNVFCVLSRKAWQFAPDDSLPAWLHKTALLEAKAWWRGELRRRRREEAAAQLGTTMKTPDHPPGVNALIPLLDEALLSLRETDRTALMLRYGEENSLREVGAALGVTDDTAQKRVQSALEKLSHFFQRRGYRTASVAATAAALKSTSVNASAMVAMAVVKAALQTAPPAVTGLKALLARVAGLTKTQAAVVCLGLVLAPLLWKAQQARWLSTEISSLQFKMDERQTQEKKLNAEVARLEAEAKRWAQARADLWRARAHEQEVAGKFRDLKARSRALLAEDNYRWPKDLPFVRIPKSALPAIGMTGQDTPAQIKVKLENFIDLSPGEREKADKLFADYFEGIDQLIKENLLEIPGPAGTKVLVLEPIGKKIRAAVERLFEDMPAVLGDEVWAMLKPDKESFIFDEQRRFLGYTNFAWDQKQQFSVRAFLNHGDPWIECSTTYGDKAEPYRETVPFGAIGRFQGPPLFIEHLKGWLAEQFPNAANK